MAQKKKNSLYENVLCRFWEQHPQNELTLQLLDSKEINWDSKEYPLFIDFVQSDTSGILFTMSESFMDSGKVGYKKVTLRFSLPTDDPQVLSKGDDTKSYFFWIKEVKHTNDQTLARIQYLKHGYMRVGDRLEFAYGDIISKKILEMANNTVNISEKLHSWFTFEENDGVYVFLRTFPNDPKNVHVVGGRSYLDVIFEDDKHVCKKIVRKTLPRKYEDYVSLTVLHFDEIEFIEKSQAKAAQELISGMDKAGDSLMELWNKYSEIEVKRVKEFRERIGGIKIYDCNQLKDSVVRVRYELTKDQETIFHNALETIKESAFEYTNMNSVTQRGRLSVLSINLALRTMDLLDEDYKVLTQGASGFLTVSTIGTEMIDTRRTYALKRLREDPSLILRNLHLAIEDQADAMVDLSNAKPQKALTERTYRFIKENLGLNDLTEDQKRAVEIAINTPDIVVIQGPPGTGKSTVVSVIADRLMEISEQAKGGSVDDRVILLSAFQHDAVEHTASKIYTYGLPSVVMGKENQTIRIQDEVIKRMKSAIDTSVNSLAPQHVVNRVSKQLTSLKELYLKEGNKSEVKRIVDEILRGNSVPSELDNDWRQLNRATKSSSTKQDEVIKALKGLRTDTQSYDDDGYEKILRLLALDAIDFSASERDLLDQAPDMEPEDDFLMKLAKLKDKYLSDLYAQENTIEGGTDNAFESWFDQAIDYFRGQESKDYEDEDTFLTSILEDLRNELEGSSSLVRQSIMDYSQSLAATNQYSGSRSLRGYQFNNVILEEAARSNPLDMLIPMTLAKHKIIMVGDQKQLPHLLERDIADEALESLKDSQGLNEDNIAERKNQYELSLFGILYNNLKKAKPLRYIQLTNQFRMHPVIGNFISRTFYQDRLKSDFVSADKKSHNLTLPWAKDKVVVWCDVPRKLGREKSGGSKERLSEAKRIISLLKEIDCDPASKNLSIGIITFYRKQVDLICQEAEEAGYTYRNVDGSYSISQEYVVTHDGREKLRIGSVDSFQGKEFDIVILSTVRSNDYERIDSNESNVFGFLMLENRLNVAFSRAQRMLITVGDKEMFSDEFAKTYVEGLYEFNQIVSGEYGTTIR